MWTQGFALGRLIRETVVHSNGIIVRGYPVENQDLFWAICRASSSLEWPRKMCLLRPLRRILANKLNVVMGLEMKLECLC
ncbi:hypothetical protein BKA56DRAFT_597236 [Ilyonectria sp. MPI-CAGE-AT-0026]|nr:hypothetical protein BKA56DRAFT_597236 [Ilyonectria sp. MPI-CAGE-AT-0026]